MSKKNDPIMSLVRSWLKGEKPIYVVSANFGGNEDYGHSGFDNLAGPTLDDAVRDAEGALDEIARQNAVPEFCEVFRADPSNFSDVIKEINNGDFADDDELQGCLVESLLSNEDFNGVSAYERLVPVKVVFAKTGDPDASSVKADLVRIHGIIDRLGQRFTRAKSLASRTALRVADLPADIFEHACPAPETYHFDTAFDATRDETPKADDKSLAELTPKEVRAHLLDLQEIFRLIVAGSIKSDHYGSLKMGAKRKFRVAIHWRVTYVRDVEAYTKEEAYDMVSDLAKQATSEDFYWEEDVTDYADRELTDKQE